MAKSPDAINVQGPDAGGGNPVPVQMTSGVGVGDVNVKQVGGTAVPTTADVIPVVPVSEAGSTPQTQNSAANSAQTITITGVAGQRARLTHLSFFYTGANTAGQATVADGGANKLVIAFGASQNTSLFVPLPAGGWAAGTGNNLAVTLPAGGAAVTSTLNICSRQY